MNYLDISDLQNIFKGNQNFPEFHFAMISNANILFKNPHNIVFLLYFHIFLDIKKF